MRLLEPLALSCMKQFQTDFYEQRNVQKVIPLLHPDVIWVFSKDLTLHGSNDVARFLESRAATMQESFTVYQTAYTATQLSDTDCQISGSMTLVYAAADSSVVTPFSVSALFRQTGDSMLLVYMHVFTQEPHTDEAPLQEASLRSVVSKRAADVRKLRRTALLSDEAEYHEILMNMPGGLFTYSAEEDAQFDFINQAVLDIFGYTEEEFRKVYNNKFDNIIHPEDRDWVLASINEQIQDSPYDEVRYRIIDSSGSVRYVHDVGRIITDASGRRMFFVVVIDITQYVLSERALATSEKRMRAIVEQSSDIIFEYDIETDHATFHSDFEHIFGRMPITDNVKKQLVASDSIVHPDDIPAIAAFFTKLHSGDPYVETELRIHTGDGAYLWCRVSASIVYDDFGRPFVAMGKIADIDKQKRETETLKTKANTDPMTGLYNKTVSAQMLSEFIAGEGKKGCHAMFMIDVDDFKSVNDHHGHLFGDSVLIAVAGVLSRSFRSSDIVGRIGGDEFMALQKYVSSMAQLEKRAESILHAVGALFPELEQPIHCTIGIALYPEHGQDLPMLYHNADIALYHAKNEGKARYCIYNAELGRAFTENDTPIPVHAEIEVAEKNPVGRQLIQNVLQTLMEKKDIQQALQTVTELLGTYFQVSRCYLYELCVDSATLSNLYQWYAAGVEISDHTLEGYTIGDLNSYAANFDEDGFFCCRDVRTLPENYARYKESLGMQSMLQCLIRNHEKLYGFLGFDQRSGSRLWTQEDLIVVRYICEILGVFIPKQQTPEQLDAASAQLEAMMAHLKHFSKPQS